MLQIAKRYVAVVDKINYRIGRIMMYFIFVMIGILLWSSISKTFFLPSLWTLEIAQFAMVAYYIMGGPYSIQMGSNVRMDLFYNEWSDKTKAWVDSFTIIFLIMYLGILLWGGFESTQYAIQYGERMAALHVANQGHHVHWNKPDVTAGDFRVGKGYFPYQG
jgi:TRAP-type mannitol/chloroaromatic compound transport system permease small subunit